MSSVRPPHDPNKTIDTVIVKEVPDSSAKNINPLTAEDLKKIIDKSAFKQDYVKT